MCVSSACVGLHFGGSTCERWGDASRYPVSLSREVGYHGAIMPSWNIHTAHVERLLARCPGDKLGIADANAFLFGNYVPDIYVGFMVPDVSYHIDYCMTHAAAVNRIPLPDGDYFWDRYIAKRMPKTPAGASLALGAWAHLVTDRCYNSRFRVFCHTHDTPMGELLRVQKQADFDLFGRALSISREVEVTPALLEAAYSFVPYRIGHQDVMRAAEVANDIVRENAVPASDANHYQLLPREWMVDAFDACDELLAIWLLAWRKLVHEGARCMAADVRERAGLPALRESE